MAERLQLRVVTPEGSLLDIGADEVTAPGTAGEFGVLPNHITFLSSLEAGRLAYKVEGRTHAIAVSGGFAEVVDNVMTVLADRAQPSEEIEPGQARLALGEAETRLQRLGENDPARADARQSLAWQQARVEAAGGD